METLSANIRGTVSSPTWIPQSSGTGTREDDRHFSDADTVKALEAVPGIAKVRANLEISEGLSRSGISRERFPWR
jgi:hypothetical protein